MDLRLDEYLDLLKQLIRQPSVVGAENAFFQTLQRELDETGAKTTRYEGLLVAEGSQPESGYYSAHVDRHGLVCTGPNEFQYAAYVAKHRGELSGNSISEQTFATVSERFRDAEVLAYQPWSGSYLGAGRIRNVHLCPRRGNMVFEIEGLETQLPGIAVAFRDRLRHLDGRLQGQIDNVICVAMLVHLFRLGFGGTAFFTAQEEAGRSWRFLLEWFQRQDRSTQSLIVLDTSPFPTLEAADAQDVVLRLRDANGVFDPQAAQRLQELCERRGLSYLYKDQRIAEENERRVAEGRNPSSLGSTELGRLVSAAGGRVTGATLQLPTCGYHTIEESASLSACQALLGLLVEHAAVVG